MIRLILAVLIALVIQETYGQNRISLGIDCNPKLNKYEIRFFDSLFVNQNYDFKDKVIGFATPNVINILGCIPVPGFNNSLSPIGKKEYFKNLALDSKNKNCSKLILLNDSLKKVTKGFDAIIISIPKKKLDKVTKKTELTIATVFGYRNLNYPDNVDKVGTDTSSILSINDIEFFNTIFMHDRKDFDFTDKRIVIADFYSKITFSKQNYITRIKKHLENDFLYPTDNLIVLTDKEKLETGFDAVILLPEKMYRRNELIEIIKKAPHNQQ